jgi:hypothetical protein
MRNKHWYLCFQKNLHFLGICEISQSPVKEGVIESTGLKDASVPNQLPRNREDTVFYNKQQLTTNCSFD